MAFASATLAQRQAVRNTVVALDKATTLAHDTGPLDTLGPDVDTAGAAVVAALAAAGASDNDTSVIVADGDAVTVENSAGTSISTAATADVADGVLAVQLPATIAGVASGSAVTVPITFVTARAAGASATVAATITVAAGVITAISIA